MAESKTTKAKKTKKKAAPSKAKLGKKLDAIYSRFIRLKHADSKGNCTCISCGRVYHWKKIQNGHYASRTCYATRWDDMNCKPQCVSCNVFKEGNKIWYRRNLVKEYGEEAVTALEDRSLLNSDFTVEDYEAKIAYYSAIVKDLELKHS